MWDTEEGCVDIDGLCAVKFLDGQSYCIMN